VIASLLSAIALFPFPPGPFPIDPTHLFLEIWIRRPSMKDLQRYLSSAPVLAAAWVTFTAGLLIEFNRFHPDYLVPPF
jgi:photosystem I subunit 9